MRFHHAFAFLIAVALVWSLGCDDGGGGGGEGDSDSDSDGDTDGDGDMDGDADTDTDADGDTDGDSDTDTDTDSDGDTDTGTGPNPDPSEACHPTAYNWSSAWAAFEDQVLVLTNQARSVTQNCDSEGVFSPAPPLTMNAYLRCAARVHSYDMASHSYFDHNSPGGPIGDNEVERMETAGYTNWNYLGENIAAGQISAQEVVDDWLDSDGHCANIMSPHFEEIGIGYAYLASSPYGHYWTQDFGKQF